ncbi:hypothetical protein HID58_079327, partial [Brassica napus]
SVSECCDNKGNFSSITFDLLPKIYSQQYYTATMNPPENFLHSMEIWIRIRHIPTVFFTAETMHTLASEIGHVDEIAYDPKVSQTKDYIRALDSTVSPAGPVLRDAPPGFPNLFPELSNEDRKMVMLYISHSDEAERLARIQRVRQGIADNLVESSSRLIRITKELDKGKCHIFSYKEADLVGSSKNTRSLAICQDKDGGSDGDTRSSSSKTSMYSASLTQMGFQLGPSSEGRVNENQGMNKSQRKHPSSWKRKSLGRRSSTTWSLQLIGVDRDVGQEADQRNIMNWKKSADLNSRDKITRLKAALETEVSK